MADREPNWFTSTPSNDAALEAAYRQACARGIGVVFFGCDFGGDDWHTEVIGEVREDGAFVVKHINQWHRTVSAEAEPIGDDGAEA